MAAAAAGPGAAAPTRPALLVLRSKKVCCYPCVSTAACTAQPPTDAEETEAGASAEPWPSAAHAAQAAPGARRPSLTRRAAAGAGTGDGGGVVLQVCEAAVVVHRETGVIVEVRMLNPEETLRMRDGGGAVGAKGNTPLSPPWEEEEGLQWREMEGEEEHRPQPEGEPPQRFSSSSSLPSERTSEATEASDFLEDKGISDEELRLELFERFGDVDVEIEDFGWQLIMPGVVDCYVDMCCAGEPEDVGGGGTVAAGDEGAGSSWEGAGPATRAAVAGGVTTLFDCPTRYAQAPLPCTVEGVRAKIEMLTPPSAATKGERSNHKEGGSPIIHSGQKYANTLHCDVGIWGLVGPDTGDECLRMLQAGCFGFAAFLSSVSSTIPAVRRSQWHKLLYTLAHSGYAVSNSGVSSSTAENSGIESGIGAPQQQQEQPQQQQQQQQLHNLRLRPESSSSSNHSSLLVGEQVPSPPGSPSSHGSQQRSNDALSLGGTSTDRSPRVRDLLTPPSANKLSSSPPFAGTVPLTAEPTPVFQNRADTLVHVPMGLRVPVMAQCTLMNTDRVSAASPMRDRAAYRRLTSEPLPLRLGLGRTSLSSSVDEGSPTTPPEESFFYEEEMLTDRQADDEQGSHDGNSDTERDSSEGDRADAHIRDSMGGVDRLSDLPPRRSEQAGQPYPEDDDPDSELSAVGRRSIDSPFLDAERMMRSNAIERRRRQKHRTQPGSACNTASATPIAPSQLATAAASKSPSVTTTVAARIRKPGALQISPKRRAGHMQATVLELLQQDSDASQLSPEGPVSPTSALLDSAVLSPTTDNLNNPNVSGAPVREMLRAHSSSESSTSTHGQDQQPPLAPAPGPASQEQHQLLQKLRSEGERQQPDRSAFVVDTSGGAATAVQLNSAEDADGVDQHRLVAPVRGNMIQELGEFEEREYDVDKADPYSSPAFMKKREDLEGMNAGVGAGATGGAGGNGNNSGSGGAAQGVRGGTGAGGAEAGAGATTKAAAAAARGSAVPRRLMRDLHMAELQSYTYAGKGPITCSNTVGGGGGRGGAVGAAGLSVVATGPRRERPGARGAADSAVLNLQTERNFSVVDHSGVTPKSGIRRVQAIEEVSAEEKLAKALNITSPASASASAASKAPSSSSSSAAANAQRKGPAIVGATAGSTMNNNNKKKKTLSGPSIDLSSLKLASGTGGRANRNSAPNSLKSSPSPETKIRAPDLSPPPLSGEKPSPALHAQLPPQASDSPGQGRCGIPRRASSVELGSRGEDGQAGLSLVLSRKDDTEGQSAVDVVPTTPPQKPRRGPVMIHTHDPTVSRRPILDALTRKRRGGSDDTSTTGVGSDSSPARSLLGSSTEESPEQDTDYSGSTVVRHSRKNSMSLPNSPTLQRKIFTDREGSGDTAVDSKPPRVVRPTLQLSGPGLGSKESTAAAASQRTTAGTQKYAVKEKPKLSSLWQRRKSAVLPGTVANGDEISRSMSLGAAGEAVVHGTNPGHALNERSASTGHSAGGRGSLVMPPQQQPQQQPDEEDGARGQGSGKFRPPAIVAFKENDRLTQLAVNREYSLYLDNYKSTYEARGTTMVLMYFSRFTCHRPVSIQALLEAPVRDVATRRTRRQRAKSVASPTMMQIRDLAAAAQQQRQQQDGEDGAEADAGGEKSVPLSPNDGLEEEDPDTEGGIIAREPMAGANDVPIRPTSDGLNASAAAHLQRLAVLAKVEQDNPRSSTSSTSTSSSSKSPSAAGDDRPSPSSSKKSVRIGFANAAPASPGSGRRLRDRKEDESFSPTMVRRRRQSSGDALKMRRALALADNDDADDVDEEEEEAEAEEMLQQLSRQLSQPQANGRGEQNSSGDTPASLSKATDPGPPSGSSGKSRLRPSIDLAHAEPSHLHDGGSNDTYHMRESEGITPNVRGVDVSHGSLGVAAPAPNLQAWMGTLAVEIDESSATATTTSLSSTGTVSSKGTAHTASPLHHTLPSPSTSPTKASNRRKAAQQYVAVRSVSGVAPSISSGLVGGGTGRGEMSTHPPLRTLHSVDASTLQWDDDDDDDDTAGQSVSEHATADLRAAARRGLYSTISDTAVTSPQRVGSVGQHGTRDRGATASPQGLTKELERSSFSARPWMGSASGGLSAATVGWASPKARSLQHLRLHAFAVSGLEAVAAIRTSKAKLQAMLHVTSVPQPLLTTGRGGSAGSGSLRPRFFSHTETGMGLESTRAASAAPGRAGGLEGSQSVEHRAVSTNELGLSAAAGSLSAMSSDAAFSLPPSMTPMRAASKSGSNQSGESAGAAWSAQPSPSEGLRSGRPSPPVQGDDLDNGATSVFDPSDLACSGFGLSASTCVYYLTQCEEEMASGDTFAKVYPPIRRQEDKEALWEALRDQVLDFVTSGHTPVPRELKFPREGDFFRAVSGTCSVQHLLPAMLTEGMTRGFATERIVEWLTEQPARFMGLRNKGKLRRGFAADIVVINVDARYRVQSDDLLSQHKCTLYDTALLRGAVQRTYVGGKLAFSRDRSSSVASGGRIAASTASASTPQASSLEAAIVYPPPGRLLLAKYHALDGTPLSL